MSRTLKRWTPEEERVLRDQVSRRPNNLAEAFRRVSVLIDRTPSAVSYHWYNVMKNTNVCFMTASARGVNPNSKIVRKEPEIIKTPKKSWWKSLLKIFGLK
jgi:hypothetical protein